MSEPCEDHSGYEDPWMCDCTRARIAALEARIAELEAELAQANVKLALLGQDAPSEFGTVTTTGALVLAQRKPGAVERFLLHPRCYDILRLPTNGRWTARFALGGGINGRRNGDTPEAAAEAALLAMEKA